MQKSWCAALALALVICLIPALRSSGAAVGAPFTQSASVQPKPNGALRIGMPEASLTVDPALAADDDNAEVSTLLYTGLVRLDAHYNVQSAAASRYAVARDHRTYTFYLRKGLRFSNGDPITAADFAFSITRSLNPSLKSPSAPTYLLDIQGARAVLTGKAKSVSGIKVIDPYTLQIRARWPVPYFLMELTYPTSYALDRKRITKLGSIDNTNWYANPISSGPYRLLSWDPNNKIVLVPNKHYLGTHPQLKQITISLGALPDTDVYNYVSKNLDVVSLPTVDPNLIRLAGMHQTKMLAIVGLYMNLKSKPFDKKQVRRALALSLDRKSAVTSSFGHTVTSFDGFVPPGQFGYDSNLKATPYNPAAARRALKAGGYALPKTFPANTLYYADDPQVAKLAQKIVHYWHKNLGISIDTKALTLNTLLAKVQANSLPLYLSGWSADYPDPHDWLSLQWRSDALNNDVHYQSAAFDRLVETADVTWNAADRLRLYNQAQELLVDDAAWIPLYNPHRAVYIRPGVTNLILTGYGLIPKSGNWAEVHALLSPTLGHRI